MKDATESRAHDHDAPIPERVLAARWNRSVRTLQRWRAQGYGPAFMLIGASIYYRLEDVLSFEARMRRGDEADQ